MPELEDRIHKRLAKKARIDRKLVRHAASSKPGHFIDTVRLGWNSFSFIFYIGGTDTIAGREDVGGYRGTQGTAVVKVFDMTAGGTGMTETELRAAGMDYRKIYTHQNGHAAYYPGTAPLFVKVLFDPAGGKLLGAQVLGWDGVDKRIDVLAVALRAGMTVFDLEHLELAYAPPYGAAKDPVNMAGFLARTCCAATSICGTPGTTRTAPGR